MERREPGERVIQTTQAVKSKSLTFDDDFRALVDRLRRIALGALPRMFRSEEGLFAFRLRRVSGHDVLEGTSGRYTAIVLIGLARWPERIAQILPGHTPETVLRRLTERCLSSTDIGEVALSLWAARAWSTPDAHALLERLTALDPVRGKHPLVETSWCLSSLCAEEEQMAAPPLAARIAERLLASLRRSTSLFQHWTVGAQIARLRAHVACYADLVYPIQALSLYHRRSGDAPALEAARGCARRMCALQGSAGQWWWHYDVRTGRVLERYPVYAIHQDAMGPMCLFDVEEACGDAQHEAIAKGMRWLVRAPEIGGSLIDEDAGVIWRKVGRREPRKLARSLQALASAVHPSARVPGIDRFFPASVIDYETRPYQMGWLLYAWPPSRC
jgi:hypothetical protein